MSENNKNNINNYYYFISSTHLEKKWAKYNCMIHYSMHDIT